MNIILYIEEPIYKNPALLKTGPPPMVKYPGPGVQKPTQITNPISQPSTGFTNAPSKNIGAPPMRVGPSPINPVNRPPTPGVTANNTVGSSSNISNNQTQFDISQVPSAHKPIVDSILSLLPVLDQIEVNNNLEQ